MGVVIRRWVWLEYIGVVSGCFPNITYISLLLLYLFIFAAASLLLFHFVKMIFRSYNRCCILCILFVYVCVHVYVCLCVCVCLGQSISY